MSELREILSEFEKQFGFDECTVCANPTVMRDTYGFPWCENHEHHGKVFDWGYRHGFPELHFHIYGLGPGEYCWWIPVLESANVGTHKGDDSFMWTALAYIEYLDSLEKTA